MLETNTTDFINGQPKNTIYGNFAFTTNLTKHSESHVMLHLPTEIFYPIMDILLGGTGKHYETKRALTDIEVAICRYVMLKFQEALKDAWNSIIKVDFAFDKIETSTKNVELKALKEEKLVMSFDVNIKDIKSKVRVAYSSRFVDKLIRKQETQKAVESVSAEQREQKKEAIMTSLNDAEFEVKAVLSELKLNMQDIISLNVGDIITLDKKITDDIEVKVEDTPWFNGKLGNGNIKKAVKITKVLGETADEETV
jgi:flagellar motor switch protein FliM